MRAIKREVKYKLRNEPMSNGIGTHRDLVCTPAWSEEPWNEIEGSYVMSVDGLRDSSWHIVHHQT